MKALRAVFPVAMAAAGAMIAALAVVATDASAQSCQVDSGGGCKNDGAKCSPPNGGKCYTVKQRRVLACVCSVNKPPNALRGSRRPTEQPPTENPN